MLIYLKKVEKIRESLISLAGVPCTKIFPLFLAVFLITRVPIPQYSPVSVLWLAVTNIFNYKVLTSLFPAVEINIFSLPLRLAVKLMQSPKHFHKTQEMAYLKFLSSSVSCDIETSISVLYSSTASAFRLPTSK